MGNVTDLVGDNCSVNKAIAARICCGFVGCAGHRFMLAMNEIIEEQMDSVNVVNAIMKKLSNLIPITKLRHLIALTAITYNQTRWTTTYGMLDRYIKIKKYIAHPDFHDVHILLPNSKTEENITELYSLLKALGRVTIALQKENIEISTVRHIFDEVIRDFPRTEHRLSEAVTNVQNSVFQYGLLKIRQGQLSRMTRKEKDATKMFTKMVQSCQKVSHTALLNAPARSGKKKFWKFFYLPGRLLRLAYFQYLRTALFHSSICL